MSFASSRELLRDDGEDVAGHLLERDLVRPANVDNAVDRIRGGCPGDRSGHLVGRDEVKQALRENSNPEKEREDAVALFEKRRRLLIRRHGEDYVLTDEARRKLAAYLLNQGYDSALVQSVVKEIPVVDD